MGASISQVLPASAGCSNRKSMLPLRPPSVCESCWRGPFSVHLGLFHAPIKRERDEQHRPFVGGHSYYASKTQVEHRSAAGCVWCTLICAGFGTVDHKVTPRADGRWKITVGLQVLQVRPGSVPTDVQGLVAIINDQTRLFTRLLHTSADDPAAPYIVARSPVLNVGSPRALSLARGLISECVHRHERCIRIAPSTDVRLPTRLVDCTHPSRPRLVSTEGRRGRFLALSYVWGEAQPHRTVRANISAYADQIDLLPQTIRDAIHVTRALGFQYLWADSLCIIQDSDEDTLHELGCMHRVYRDASLTIVAASAKRASEGFLQDRPVRKDDLVLPFICPRPPRGERVVSLQRVGEVRTTTLSVSDAGDVISGRDSVLEPVHERGWCLQEFYMSPRALIFTSETLRFRCQQATQNIGHSFYHSTTDEVRLPDALFNPDAPWPVENGSKEWMSVHRVWCTVVHQYTRRTIGQASDKLVACGALAEAFHHGLRSEYLAGLWRDTLLHDLLWTKMENDGARCLSPSQGASSDRPAVYRAPSWSWAVVEGTVRIRTFSEFVGAQAIAAVLLCDVVLKDQTLPFGEVTGGTLVLRAALVHPTCKVRFGHWRDESSISSSRLRARLFSGAGSPTYENSILADGTLPGWCTVDHAADRFIKSGRAWLVPLLWHEFLSDVLGLIVTTTSVPGTDGRKAFRRIGQFCADADSWAALWDADESLPLVEVEIV